MELCNHYREVLFVNIYNFLEDDGDLREALIGFGSALAELITSDVVISAQRGVIGVAERMPSISREFYERGPKRGRAKLRGLLDRNVATGGLDIPDTELATYQLVDLFMSGMFKKRLYGCMEGPPSQELIRRTVTAGVDVFLRAYRPS